MPLYQHLLKQNAQLIGCRSVGTLLLDSLTSLSLVKQNRRSYHAIKGVFGNYRPASSPAALDAKRQIILDDSLPAAHRLVKDAFQKRGHQLAQLNLLEANTAIGDGSLQQMSTVLGVDLSRFVAQSEDGEQYLQQLVQLYCGGIAYEFAHLATTEEVQWFEREVEQIAADTGTFNAEAVAKSLLEAEAFDHFLAKKFQSVKRYGGEGAETMITFIEELVRLSAGVNSELVIGMAHRGRLNLLVNTLKVPAEVLFRKMSGKNEFEMKPSFIGDVLSHIYTSEPLNGDLRVTLLPNPSHLEVVGTVACGYARGKMMDTREGPYDHEAPSSQPEQYRRVPLQIHGDAAISGQGIVMETLAMANVDHWTIGGSIHLIVNNQVGYTTPGRYGQARSSLHSSDLVKMIHAPVIHVNGANPQAVVKAAQLAHAYRAHFQKDVCVNLICFRRWGHNELDDPTFTNPLLYKAIAKQESIPKQFVQQIGLPQSTVTEILQAYNNQLNAALAAVDTFKPAPVSNIYARNAWADIKWPEEKITKWRTAVPAGVLRQIGDLSVSVPESFNLHSTLRRVFADRLKKIAAEGTAAMDWATAESLAFGSLLWEGYNVRIAGQDVGRGTFSQRHCMVVDQESDDIHIPLNGINKSPLERRAEVERYGKLEVCNSILSEEAVIAYEYGLSLASPQVLPIWEAQFGDFFNGAQSVIDTLVASGEAKWMLQSALTLLLPHGYDGAGPEHTSSRLERFLQLSNSSETDIDTDLINWCVAYPTTPAQYFHLLRRQMIRPYRKPLVVMSPKMLLRHPRCVSALAELSAPNGHFAAVLDDPKHYPGEPLQPAIIDQGRLVDSVKTIVFCSGKHYYALEKEREDRVASGRLASASSIALVRLEELSPFPVESLVQILKRYPNAKNLLWSQEEHRNMGAWTFVAPRFTNILKRQLTYVGRGHLSAPAVGIGSIHQAEMKQILEETFKQC